LVKHKVEAKGDARGRWHAREVAWSFGAFIATKMEVSAQVEGFDEAED
jgi:hypothetical protein